MAQEIIQCDAIKSTIKCRTCLCDEEADSNMIYILEHIQHSEENIQINDMIMKFCDVKIAPDDMFSKMICSKCVEDVKTAFEFKLKCEETNHELLQQHNDHFTEKIIGCTLLKDEHKVDDYKQDGLKAAYPSDVIPYSNPEVLPIYFQTKSEEKDGSSQQQCNEIPSQNSKTSTKSKRKIMVGEKVKVKRIRKKKPPETPEKVYACDMCIYTSNNERYLKVHQFTHESYKAVQCPKCEIICKNLTILKRHLKIHDEYKPYGCEFCSFRSHRLDSVREHTRKHTGIKPYLCDQCHYKCTTYTLLRVHKRNKHSDEKRFVCHECSYRAKTRSTLVTHIKTHNNEKRFVCDKCPYSSRTLNLLKNHDKSVHTGERPFRCDKCSYSAITASLLKTHSRVHFGVKNHKCLECGLEFYTKSRLKVHTLSHTGEKPHCCTLCDFKTANSSSLRRHERAVHRIMGHPADASGEESSSNLQSELAS